MAITHHHLNALLTPTGRVAPVAFFALFVPLVVADVLLAQAIASTAEAERTLSLAAALMLAVVWMQYCLLSRRLHDSGQSAAVLIGFLLLAVAAWYKGLDPDFLDPDLSPTDRYAGLMPHLHHAGRVVAVVLFAMLLAKPGMAGPNRFGQEFGESEGRVSRWRTEGVMGVQAPAGVSPAAVPDTPKVAPRGDASARRCRQASMVPIPGELSRTSRSGNFGRR